MPNLNEHDILFLGSTENEKFSAFLEQEYDFRIHSYDFPPFVSFTSRKAVLNTSRGIFFLKEKPEYCSEEQTRNRAAEFQNYIHASTQIAPEVFSTVSGSYYTYWEGRYFFLTEFKEGRIYNGSEKDLVCALNSLKEFRRAAQAYDAASSPTGHRESFSAISFLPYVKEHVKSREDEEVFARVKLLLNSLTDSYLALHHENYEMCHGDFSLFNLLFDTSGVVAINDFDNIDRYPRIHDLAEFLVSATLINYIAPITNLKLPVLTKPSRRPFLRILDYYSRNFNLSASEKDLLPVVAEIVWLEILLLAVAKGDYTFLDIDAALKQIESRYLRLEVSRILDRSEEMTFIWDFHGTLETGTLFILTEIANILLGEHGSNARYTPAEFATIPSFSWETFFSSHFKNLSQKEIDLIANSAYDEQRFDYLIQKHSKASLNAKTVLKFVKKNGGKNIVVSHSRQNKLGLYISKVGLSEYIDSYYGIDDGTIKSKQDVLKKKANVISNLLGSSGNSTFYAVGDADMDFAAARSVGVKKFYWLLPINNKGTKQRMYKGVASTKLKFIVDLSEIIKDLAEDKNAF